MGDGGSSPEFVRGYRLDRLLGEGGMGSVHVAEKLATHQSFAVKLMHDRLVADGSYIVRFEREIGALRAIRHPNVVDVFEWYLPTKDSTEPPFLVMELLDGEGLDQLLKRQRVLPIAMAVEVTLQVLDGLAAAHAVGVIHRDLGPSNVFLEPEAGGKFRVKILDFGLARPLLRGEGEVNVTQQGTLMGKPAYVAPELLAGEELDARSDLYAVAIMLYRMVTGRFPYRETAAQLLWVERYSERNHANEYPSARTHNPKVPGSLDAVIARSMRRNPNERYPSAREMQQALLAVEADILDGQETVLIQPSSRLTGEVSSSALVGRSQLSLSRPELRRRRVRFVALAAAGTAVLVVALLLLFARGGGEERPAPAVLPGADAELAAPAPPGDIAEVRHVHLVVFGAPPDSTVKVGDLSLFGFPPEGDVPWSDREVDVVVAARGFDTFRARVTPDRHQTVHAQLQPLATTPTEPVREPDAGPADAGSAPADDAEPARRDAGRAPRDAARRADASAPSTDASSPPATGTLVPGGRGIEIQTTFQ